MKKIIAITISILIGFTTNAQDMKWKYPMDFAFGIGHAFANNSAPITYSGGGELKSGFSTCSAKIMGVIMSFGYDCDFTNERVYGYPKIIESQYMKFGFEIGKVYFMTKNNKLHSISLAPTHMIRLITLMDTSGNTIGWTDNDYVKRRQFYNGTSEYEAEEWGITVGYAYEFFGVDLSICSSGFEITFNFQISMYQKCSARYIGLSLF